MFNSGVPHPVIERVTSGARVITTDHGSIHNKEGYSISGIFTAVANNTTVNYAFKTPTVASGKYVHLKFLQVGATANKVRVDLLEAPTAAPTLGTDLVAYNRNRIGTEVPTVMQAIKSGMTVNAAGAKTLESKQFVLGDSRSLDIEWVLKPDTWYIRTFTNGTGGAADIDFFEFWYEEDMG